MIVRHAAGQRMDQALDLFMPDRETSRHFGCIDVAAVGAVSACLVAFVPAILGRQHMTAVRALNPRRVGGIDAGRAEFLFHPDAHARERLVLDTRELRLQVLETGPAAQLLDQTFRCLGFTRDRQADALGSQQDRAFQMPSPACGQQRRAPILEIGQPRRTVGGDADEGMHGQARADGFQGLPGGSLYLCSRSRQRDDRSTAPPRVAVANR